MEDKELTGWQKLCKRFGSINFNGEEYIWDYVSDAAVLRDKMSALDLKKSNQAKWDKLKSIAK